MPDSEFLLLGDALWLDFVNTAPGPEQRADQLPDPGAWLRWTKAVRVEPPEDAAAFADALKFRGRLVAVAGALDARRNPPPSAIEAINLLLAGMVGREQLVRISGAWRLRFSPVRAPAALEAIAQSVAGTLSNPLAVVRTCANPECHLYFVDESPSQVRAWCSPSRCGRRGRYERRRSTRPTPLVTEG